MSPFRASASCTSLAPKFKYFAFAVTVIIFKKIGDRIVRIARKEACNCRFAPADKRGSVPAVLFADWRNYSLPTDVERIPLLNAGAPWADLQQRLANRTKDRKFAILSRVPTPDYCYYPIPYYAALFKGKWYDIKRLIAVAKEAKLRNAAAGTPADDEQLLISSLQAIELDLLQGKPLPYKQLVSLVDYIRQREEVFPEWQTSTTAELYKSHYFENKKHSSGNWW